MVFKIWFTKKKKRELDRIGVEASLTHEENIENIKQSRQDAQLLTKVLKQNHITIEIAGAMGHK